jgi:phospholipase C
VVVILEENESASAIMGSLSATYFNGLARDGATATNYTAIRHPSLPNYLALTSGTTAGHASDCLPAACPAAVRSIASTLTAAKRSWKFYGESMPGPCFLTNSGDYAVRHNPFAYYPEVTDDRAYCRAHVVPYSRFAEDLAAGALPDFAFISPNVCNDMHDCSIATGDLWLSREVPRILASTAFTVERSLLVVVFDEGRGGNNTVPIALAGPVARPGATSSRPYTHYSLLHTIELLLGLPPLTGNDRSAAPMTDLLR